MNRFTRIISLAIVLTVGPSSMTSGQTISTTPEKSLDSQIRAEVSGFKGKVYLFAKNLDTGQTYSYNGDERVRTASTIKIAVMIEAWARVAEGKAKWTDELVLTKAARYAGSGILPEMSDGLRLSFQDSVRLMMLALPFMSPTPGRPRSRSNKDSGGGVYSPNSDLSLSALLAAPAAAITGATAGMGGVYSSSGSSSYSPSS